jgi:DNA-binding YbaB/EbfC family protein
MTSPDFADLFQKAQQAQQKIAELQRDLAQRRVEGESGGGMVTVVATGALRILEIRIEPSLLESGDASMIQDLTAAAVNAALTNAQRMVQEEFQRPRSISNCQARSAPKAPNRRCKAHPHRSSA